MTYGLYIIISICGVIAPNFFDCFKMQKRHISIYGIFVLTQGRIQGWMWGSDHPIGLFKNFIK